MFMQHNLISKTSLNSSLIKEVDILAYELNNQFYSWDFKCLAFEPIPDKNNKEDYYSHYNINAIIAINNIREVLSHKDIATITKICETYYDYIHSYMEYKYFISKFIDDYEYYNNCYDWKFTFVLPFDEDTYIPIFNCIFVTK